MDGHLYADVDKILQLSRRFDVDSQTVRCTVEKLDNVVEDLKGAWTGETASVFFNKYEGCKQSMRQVFMELHEMGLKMQRAASIIGEKDRESADMMGGLGNK